MTTQSQMELALPGKLRKTSSIPEPRRARARWWFEQMHRAVDQAMEWRPNRQRRGIQSHFAIES